MGALHKTNALILSERSRNQMRCPIVVTVGNDAKSMAGRLLDKLWPFDALGVRNKTALALSPL